MMIGPLQSRKINNVLLCEPTTRPDFSRLMTELEIYVNGMEVKLVQTTNTFMDVTRADIIKQYDPGTSDLYLRQFITAHVNNNNFYHYGTGQNMAKIARSLREAHKNNFFSIPMDNPLEVMVTRGDKEKVEVAYPE